MAEGYHDRHSNEVVLRPDELPGVPRFKNHDFSLGEGFVAHPCAIKSFPVSISKEALNRANNLRTDGVTITCDTSDWEDRGSEADCVTDAQSRETSSTSTPELTHADLLSDPYQLDHDLSREVGKDVYDIRDLGSVAAFVNSRIECGLEPGSFLVTNLAPIAGQVRQWRAELPMVEPFYAVKCNPDPVILRLLASHGVNFDCATMGEIDLVLNGLGDDLSFGPRGRASNSIVYANPAKMEHMLRFAMENDVRMTVFDGEDELYKIASLGGQDKLDLLLRLTTDDKASVCRFSKKFGCPVAEAPQLLEVAKSLGLHVAGVSFHVGSGCGDADAYVTALDHALRVFQAAEKLGMPKMTIVDIGGGFPGDTSGYGGEGMPTFQKLAAAVRKGYKSFADAISPRPISEVRFIAEPGRYFVSASTAIATKIYARKGGNSTDHQALYVDDGVYGSFNTIVYDHATPVPQRLTSVMHKEKLQKEGLEVPKDEQIPTAVFGPTCDGLDQMCSLDNTTLPRCDIGEWLFWDNQGAYTHTASFVFNGYTHLPQKTYCVL
jgi:ornithine decarboxylase